MCSDFSLAAMCVNFQRTKIERKTVYLPEEQIEMHKYDASVGERESCENRDRKREKESQ